MPLYNAEMYVAEAIQSVINQTYTNWELIIVNDGSTDNSLAVAKQFETDKIKVHNQENKGASAARNHGFSLSKGEYIKFFDADDIINPEMLENQISLAVDNPNSVIAGKWGRFYNDDLGTLKIRKEECWVDMLPIDWIQSSWKNAQTMTQPGIFLIPKKNIELAGLWNDKLSLVDDMEFYTKNILAAKKVLFCEKSILYYRSGMGANALSGKKSRKSVESYFLAIELSTSYLLAKVVSPLSKLCSANLWQGFVYEYYIQQPDLVKKAYKKIQELGGSDLKFSSGGLTKILSTLFGWKWTLKIKNLYG